MISKFWKLAEKKEKIYLLSRYVLVSVFSYLFVFGGLWFLVENIELNKIYSFVLVYGLNYLIVYFFQRKIVFKKSHTKRILFKYLTSLFFFYMAGILTYNLFLFFDIHYFLSTGLTILILFPMRFYVLKYLVYGDE